MEHAELQFDARRPGVATGGLPSMLARPVRRAAILGTIPPRRCGIATYTADLQRSFQEVEGWQWEIVAIVDDDHPFEASDALIGISQHQQGDYAAAARHLNRLDFDIVSIQHEFGIFGGPDGSWIVDFVDALACPAVVTFHTILAAPTLSQRLVIAALLRKSASVIVMAEKGRTLLIELYGADASRITVCPHGAPDLPQAPSSSFKGKLDLAGRAVLLTFGLLSPGKGIETMIAAMPDIVAAHPEALYVVLGATHPNLLRRDGEAYRQGLVDLADKLGVLDHVRFVDAFVDMPQLLDYLGASDIYVTPYLNEAQLTSGTLAYAVALGKPVVTTPFWHAVELVDQHSGAIVGFGHASAFASAIIGFLDDPARLGAAGDAAYLRGRLSIWARSSEHYLGAFTRALEIPAGVDLSMEITVWNCAARLDAVIASTDSCGIFQHSTYGVADRAHGYCLDDAVRGLLLVQRLRRLGEAGPKLDVLERTYAAFVQHAWNPDTGRFRNFMGYDRRWLEPAGSDDSNGRALWAIAETCTHAAAPEVRQWAQALTRSTGQLAMDLRSLRAQCFAMQAACVLCMADPEDQSCRTTVFEIAESLMRRLELHGSPLWHWFEPSLSYDNARIPHALIVAGMVMRRPDWLAAGLDSLQWLAGVQTAPRGGFRAVGSDTLKTDYAPPGLFDQQPLEATAMVEATLAAYEATRQPKWLLEARSAHAWFYGRNDLDLPLADEIGGCFDGLRADGVNRNQGAESILSLQLANAAMADYGAPVPFGSPVVRFARP